MCCEVTKANRLNNKERKTTVSRLLWHTMWKQHPFSFGFSGPFKMHNRNISFSWILNVQGHYRLLAICLWKQLFPFLSCFTFMYMARLFLVLIRSPLFSSGVSHWDFTGQCDLPEVLQFHCSNQLSCLVRTRCLHQASLLFSSRADPDPAKNKKEGADFPAEWSQSGLKFLIQSF